MRACLTLILCSALLLAHADQAHADHNCATVGKGACETESFKLPTSVAEFMALRAKWAKDPWHGATLWVAAMLVRQSNEALGNKLVVIATHPRLLTSGKWYKGYAMSRSELTFAKPRCMRGLVAGTDYRQGYKFDPNDVKLRFRVQNRYVGSVTGTTYKVFVYNSGADHAQPLTLMSTTTGWKVSNWSSVKANCRPIPAPPTPDL